MQAQGTALVTGASRGLGRAVALELAQRGFEVVATMRDPTAGEGVAAEVRAAGAAGSLRIARLDVEQPDTIEIPSGLKVLVNNAGIEGEYLAVEDAPLAHWRRLFETNVFGLVETTRHAIPVLRASGGGVICNITSSSVLFPMPFYAAYRASKAAVAALGESLRAELEPHRIRVLEILPGPIETDMLAASGRIAESSRNAAYRELAERAYQQRQGIGPLVTSAPRAASAIVDAILDDASPLRRGCDPLSDGSLAGWRATSDEDWMRGFLTTLGL
jgi:NAD(P)-dependent dehydrogenase (short-subunit alcohol dehydrogenase family)